MIKGSIQEEDLIIVHIIQTLTDIKGETDSNTIVVRL